MKSPIRLGFETVRVPRKQWLEALLTPSIRNEPHGHTDTQAIVNTEVIVCKIRGSMEIFGDQPNVLSLDQSVDTHIHLDRLRE